MSTRADEAGAASSAPRAQRMFLVLAGFFIANAIIAEFIGVKIFALEDTLGLQPFEWNLFQQSGSLNFTAGTLLWPIVFIMTDVINEFYGRRGVRFLSWLAVGLIAYAFLFAYAAIALAPASWWIGAAKDDGVPDLQLAYAYVFGQGLWTIAGSVTAFLIASDRRARVPLDPARTGDGTSGCVQRYRRCVAVHRQFRGALHRLRDRPATLEHEPLAGGRHRQLQLQGAGGDRVDSADLLAAQGHRSLAGQGSRCSAEAGSRGLRQATAQYNATCRG